MMDNKHNPLTENKGRKAFNFFPYLNELLNKCFLQETTNKSYPTSSWTR